MLVEIVYVQMVHCRGGVSQQSQYEDQLEENVLHHWCGGSCLHRNTKKRGDTEKEANSDTRSYCAHMGKQGDEQGGHANDVQADAVQAEEQAAHTRLQRVLL